MNFNAPAGYANEFINQFTQEFPEQANLVDQSINNYGELLPHFFVADLVRFLVAKYCELKRQDENINLIKRIMEFMEHQFVSAPPLIVELIAVSFVENMPYEHEGGARIVDLLPASLKAELARQR